MTITNEEKTLSNVSTGSHFSDERSGRVKKQSRLLQEACFEVVLVSSNNKVRI